MQRHEGAGEPDTKRRRSPARHGPRTFPGGGLGDTLFHRPRPRSAVSVLQTPKQKLTPLRLRRRRDGGRCSLLCASPAPCALPEKAGLLLQGCVPAPGKCLPQFPTTWLEEAAVAVQTGLVTAPRRDRAGTAEQDSFHRQGWGCRARGARCAPLTLLPILIQMRKTRPAPVRSHPTDVAPLCPAPRVTQQRLRRIFTPITSESLPTCSTLLSETFPRLWKHPRLKP